MLELELRAITICFGIFVEIVIEGEILENLSIWILMLSCGNWALELAVGQLIGSW